MADDKKISNQLKRRWWRRKRNWLLILFAIAVIRFAWGYYNAQITPAADTTFIFPDASGRIDYLKDLQNRYAKGINIENNAAVPLLHAIGPTLLSEAHSQIAAFTGSYDSTELLAINDYFIPLGSYFLLHRPVVLNHSGSPTPQDPRIGAYDQKDSDEEYALISTPWTAEKYPDVARWVASCEKPLHFALEASLRPRLYMGIVSNSKSHFIWTTYPSLSFGCIRDLTNALLIRAMLGIATNQLDASREEIFAVHRLARLMAQGPTLFDHEFAMTLEEEALEADLAFLHARPMTATQATAYLHDLAALSPIPGLQDALDHYERYFWLDLLTSCATRGGWETSNIMWEPSDGYMFPHSSLKALNILPVHYNAALRHVNALYDRAIAAENLPNYPERKAARSALRTRPRSSGGPGTFDELFMILSPLDKRIFIQNDPFEYYMVPDRFEQDRMRLDLAYLAFALAAYKADHHIYPATLGELAPIYLPKIPNDRFTNTPLIYNPTPGHDDYILYSRGPNMLDDHATPRTDERSMTDDLPVSPTRQIKMYPLSSGVRLDGFQ